MQVPASRERPRVIFIRGVTPRSGTNYLRDLLVLHPACQKARAPIWEDFALDDAVLLEQYVKRLFAKWPKGWAVPSEVGSEVLQALGDGLITSLIGNDPESTVVAKTPSVSGLDSFSRLFPTDRLVLLVRDGRDVVVSLERSFGWSFERAVREWTRGAETIVRYCDANRAEEGTRWQLVRYEDLLSDLASSLADLVSFAGLAEGLLDVEEARRLPVRGSSTFGLTEGRVHWRPTEQDATFNPVRRWADWDLQRHKRFNWVAGEAMRQLGYELRLDSAPSSGQLRNRAMDVQAMLAAGGRAARRRAREASFGLPGSARS